MPLAPGLNHLAFHVASRALVDELTAEALLHGTPVGPHLWSSTPRARSPARAAPPRWQN
jgi:hypothetical protein